MKHLLITIGILLIIFPALSTGQNNDSTYKLIGLNMYHTNTESGYGGSITLNMSIEKEKRHLEAGIIMQQESATISGGEILYRHYISSVYRNGNPINNQSRNLRFYFQYNFIFRKHILPDGFGTIPSTLQEVVVPGGRIATFEHYVGLGTQVKIFDQFFINTGLGYGIILGSIDDKFLDEPHYTMGGRKNDFGLVTRFGVSYFISR